MHRHKFKFCGSSRSWVTLEWQYNFKCEVCGTLRKMEPDVFWGKKIELKPRTVDIVQSVLNIGSTPPAAMTRMIERTVQRDLTIPRRIGW